MPTDSAKKVLIVDDNPEIIEIFQERLELSGFAVAAAHDSRETMEKLESFGPGVVILDIYLEQDENGIDVLKKIRTRYSGDRLAVYVLTGQPDADLCKEALLEGADDFITKPVMDIDALVAKLEGWFARYGLLGHRAETVEPKWIGKSAVALDVVKQLFAAAREDRDTLLVGETGTGKDLVAREFHHISHRKAKPFAIIDCTIIPRELFESQVFGYEKGAFSQAWSGHPGLVAAADDGILFFNEIGDLPLEQQKKLLTFWETKTYYRLGSNKPVRSTALILAATNRDLKTMVAEGSFRKDLYHRLMHHVITLPPLREHIEDIPLLCDHFIRQANPMFHKQVRELEGALLEKMLAYAWPGNVRELRSMVFHGVHHASGTRLVQLPAMDFSASGDSGVLEEDMLERPYRDAKEQMTAGFHEQYLVFHLNKHAWNVSKTAAGIGISREQLHQLMKKFKINRPS